MPALGSGMGRPLSPYGKRPQFGDRLVLSWLCGRGSPLLAFCHLYPCPPADGRLRVFCHSYLSWPSAAHAQVGKVGNDGPGALWPFAARIDGLFILWHLKEREGCVPRGVPQPGCLQGLCWGEWCQGSQARLCPRPPRVVGFPREGLQLSRASRLSLCTFTLCLPSCLTTEQLQVDPKALAFLLTFGKLRGDPVLTFTASHGARDNASSESVLFPAGEARQSQPFRPLGGSWDERPGRVSLNLASDLSLESELLSSPAIVCPCACLNPSLQRPWLPLPCSTVKWLLLSATFFPFCEMGALQREGRVKHRSEQKKALRSASRE